jgi:poly(ADP-ribose) glycohydrolase
MSTNALDLLEMFQIMAQVALELPFLFPIAPSLLFAVEESTKDDCIFHIKNVHLTKRQVFALLVHAFFTTFPDQSEHTGKEFPFFDMRSLFGSATRKDPPWSKTLLVQKLLTILAYFECMSNILKRQNDVLQNEILSYSRVSMELSLLKIQNVVQLPKQGVLHLQMSNILEKLFVNSKMFSFMIESNVNGGDGGKLIEDCMDCVQVDFANAFAGGGIFGRGCVQEEIRFLISPELMISCLLMEKLQDHEAFFIEGSERIAKYIGCT